MYLNKEIYVNIFINNLHINFHLPVSNTFACVW